jgi:SAM-dependent methyltransferase
LIGELSEIIPTGPGNGPTGSPFSIWGIRRMSPIGQAQHWSRHASHYDDVFLDPFAADVENPLLRSIAAIPDPGSKSVIDLGCGTGPLLPLLIEHFESVTALDFAPSMIERSRARLGENAGRVRFLLRPMHELADLVGSFNVAVAVNSLVMPDPRLIDKTLSAIYAALKPGGQFLGAVPSIDAIQYQTLLLHDRALASGLDVRAADRQAAEQAEHHLYDFAFGRFAYQGLRQNFWQPFELEFRLAKAGFVNVRLEKLLYPWDDNLPQGSAFRDQPRSWDWTFAADRAP